MTKACNAMLLTALLAAPGSAQPVGPAAAPAPGQANPTYTERTSDEALRALQNAKPAAEKTPARAAPRPYNIMAMSDFIAFDELSTLVPKGAILHIPEGFRSNVVTAPKGKLLLWKEFLTRNRARVAPLEITVEEATGAKPVDPKTLETAMRGGKILVAAIHGNPTSVARPATPPAASVPP